MPDLPQYPIQTPTPQTPGVNPVLQANPFESISAGIQSGTSMGLQQRQVAALEQERQTQLMQAQYAVKAAQEKQLIDYMGVAHETYKDLADVNPEHAFQFYKTSIAPLHQAFLQSKGIQADFSNVNPEEEPPPIIEKMNELMDKASQDPSKIPSVVVTLQQMANMPSVGKIYKQRLEDSMKALGTVTDANKHLDQLEQDFANQINVTKGRSGGYGLQDQKVDQAIHLRQLANQYLDPKTGNYNVPKAQYTEMVLGLANLLSPTGTADTETRSNLQSLTAKGNLSGAIQFLTGQPQTGNTQAIIKNLIDSVDRQGQTAQQLRDNYLTQIQPPSNLPTDRALRQIEKGRGSNYSDYLPKGNKNQSQTIQRKGKDGQIYTYTLNPKTGKYE